MWLSRRNVQASWGDCSLGVKNDILNQTAYALQKIEDICKIIDFSDNMRDLTCPCLAPEGVGGGSDRFAHSAKPPYRDLVLATDRF